jgi:peptide/nickel transport system substrate-binding protein
MLKRFRFWARLIRSFILRYFRQIIIGVTLGGLAFWFGPQLMYQLPATRPMDRVGVIGRYNEANLPRFIQQQVSIGLTQIDEHNSPYAGLAASWEAQDDGKTWVFWLSKEFNWSDQQPIVSTDITYRFNDEGVNIDISDPQKIVFSLPDAFAPFPVVVSRPIFKDRFTGIGPYNLSRLQRSGQYFESLELTPVSKSTSRPKLRYRFYPTEDAAKLGFKLGEIDKIVDLIDASGFQDWNNVVIEQHPQPNHYVGLYFSQDHPDLSQKAIRQGLAYAINNKTFNRPRVISSIPEHSWAHNPNVKQYEYELERAKTLLGIETDTQQPTLQLTISTTEPLLPVAESIAQDWHAVNVQTSAKVITDVSEGFDILLVTQEVSADPDQYALWHSTQPTNIINYQNPKIDKLLEDGRKTIDKDQRNQIYQDFQRFLNEDLPVLFLYQPITYSITRT